MAEDTQYANMDTDLLPVFLEEAREQIETLDQGLVRLEREPDNTELIQAIFRAAHTLKGSSGAMGFRAMAHLTHAMEDVLDRVREKQLVVTTQVADTLLQGLDHLRDLQRAIEEGRFDELHSPDSEKVVEQLHVIASARASDDDSTRQSVSLGALADDCLGLLINIADDCQMPSIRAFMALQALDGLGKVVSCIPSRREVDDGNVGHRLLVGLQTDHPEDALRQAVLGIAEVEWIRIARGASAAGLTLDQPAREEMGTGEEREENEARAVTRSGQLPGKVLAAEQTVRVGVNTLDRIMNLVGELVLDRTRVAQLKEELPSHQRNEEFVRDLDAVSQHIGSIVEELHEQVLQARMLPVSQLFNRFPRLVRDLSHTLGKEVDFIIEGETEKLDRSVIEKLVDPLTHVLRNSIDHGLELPEEREALGKPRCGTVKLSARRQEENVLIEVADDGKGIDAERLREKAIAAGAIAAEQAALMSPREAFGLIFLSGLSTARAVTDVSGRGVGMDVVKKNVESINGTIAIDSTPGLGTTLTLKIPLTLAIVRSLMVRVGSVAMAIPLSVVDEAITMERHHLHSVRGRAMFQWRNSAVPVVRLAHIMPGCGHSEEGREVHMVVVRYDNRVACIAVDDIIGHQEIVVKPLGSFLGEIPGIAGATIMGNGRVALIIDIGNLFDGELLRMAVESGLRGNRFSLPVGDGNGQVPVPAAAGMA